MTQLKERILLEEPQDELPAVEITEPVVLTT